MNFGEILARLKDHANKILGDRGWSISFELKEETENLFVLALKNRLVGKDSPMKKWNLNAFKSFYNDERQRLDFEEADLHFYLQKVENDFDELYKNTAIKLLYDYYQNNNTSYIKNFKIQNLFSIDLIFVENDVNSKEIYFLGENGDGKTLILMGIFLAFNKSDIEINTEQRLTGKITDIIRQNKALRLNGRDFNNLEYGDNKGVYLKNLFAYGVHRGRYNTDNAEQYGFMSLFDNDLVLNNPESWLKQLHFSDLEKRSNENKMFGEQRELHPIFPLVVIQELLHEVLERNVKIEVKADRVKFIEKGYTLSFEQLSEGYKNLIIWICDLIFRLLKNQPDAEQLNQFRGVVMVDEIELHLHPKWQRTLAGKLRKFFPNIQFIFTTHSPTIIQGASDEAIIYRVYRDAETGHTHVSEPYYKKDLDELMHNSLVTSPLFGLEDARMTDKPLDPDTSDSYTLYRINKRVEARLADQKKNGKVLITDAEIDALIDEILNEAPGNDQNK